VPVATSTAVEQIAVSEPVVVGPEQAAPPQMPAFIPPNMLPPPGPCTGVKADEPEPPAFIPPEVVLQRRSRPSA
jgi:hypothetical protein